MRQVKAKRMNAEARVRSAEWKRGSRHGFVIPHYALRTPNAALRSPHSTLLLQNRQHVRRVNVRLLRRIAQSLLGEFHGVGRWELCVHLVGAKEMARVNATFLGHEGSTDVITFDHSGNAECPEAAGRSAKSKRSIPHSTLRIPNSIHGELFICMDDAVAQARQFKTVWQNELVRYLIHGVLHLCGHDDLQVAARRRMKRQENRLLRDLSRRFDLSGL